MTNNWASYFQYTFSDTSYAQLDMEIQAVVLKINFQLSGLLYHML